jgi:outer membrane immunogenic protein
MRPIYKAPPPIPVFNWSGCYFGGQIGGQWGEWTADVNYPATGAVASRELDGEGSFIYGGQIGCNWQPVGGSFVFGIEGDIVGRSRDEFRGEIYRFAAPTTDHFDASGRYGTQASLRLRLGFGFDRMLLYIAGGGTWAKLWASHFVHRDGVGFAQFDVDRRRSGWNVAVGGEYAFASNITVGLEYRYTDYGSFNYDIPAGTVGAFAWAAHTASVDDLSTSDLRLRLNYLFGGAPVYSKY